MGYTGKITFCQGNRIIPYFAQNRCECSMQDEKSSVKVSHTCPFIACLLRQIQFVFQTRRLGASSHHWTIARLLWHFKDRNSKTL
nr:hypothetical protein [Physocyclus mexicanus]